jgi:N-acetyl-anhydromuramyl-L-alanine amidase AmpD
MGYTNSKMVVYKRLSPNYSGKRTHSIDRITPHCVVGQCTAEGLGSWFAQASTQASSNYGIDKDGRVGLYVEEKNRSWCSSSNANDQRAVTIECASDTKEPYRMNSKVYATLVKLCVDICKRNGKKKLIWFGDKAKTLNYTPKSDEMILTVHRWFANKSCRGTGSIAGLTNWRRR